MNLAQYKIQRRQLLEQAPKFRNLCLACRQPDFRCYCAQIRRFNPGVKFIILIHPIEVRRPIATGRLAYLTLEDSEIIVGHNYSNNKQVTAIISNPDYYPVILYPGVSAKNITPMTMPERSQLFPKDKKLVIFVIDGTWNTAKQTVKQSANLQGLPQFFFTPPKPSNFRVRTQPSPECYSTVEAIHHTLELLGNSRGFDVSSRKHDALIATFDHVVEKQLAFVKPNATRHQRKLKALAALQTSL